MPVGVLHRAWRLHPDPVVFHFNHHLRTGDAAAQKNAAAFHLRRQAMLDGIFHQRLQQHAGNHHVERGGIEIPHNIQLVPPETQHFNIEIVIDELKLFPQRGECFASIEQAAKNGSQLENHVPRGFRVNPDQRRNRIQRVKQKVRIDLVLQRLHARMQQQSLLLLEFDLNPNAVEDFQLDSNGDHRSGVNSSFHPQVGTLQAENRMRKIARPFHLHKTQSNDGREKHDLPVEQTRSGKVAANQAVNTQIDKRRERPDVVFIARHGAQLPGKKSAEQTKGQRRPFSVQHGRNGHQQAAQRARPATANRAEQKRGLKAQISSQKAGNGKTDPDANRDRQAKPEHEVEFLPEGSFFAKQQRLELNRANQSAGNDRGHSQLEHQMDEYEPWFHEISGRTS